MTMPMASTLDVAYFRVILTCSQSFVLPSHPWSLFGTEIVPYQLLMLTRCQLTCLGYLLFTSGLTGSPVTQNSQAL